MSIFNSYLNKGLLKKQRSNFKQIERQIMRALRDLKTARNVLEHDPEWATTIAYQAMLRGGRALLHSYGYLPADGSQHKTVVDITKSLLGEEYKNVTLQFNKLRKKRNLFFYESEDTENYAEAVDAIDTGFKLLKLVRQHIEKNNPQIKLNIEG